MDPLEGVLVFLIYLFSLINWIVYRKNRSSIMQRLRKPDPINEGELEKPDRIHAGGSH